MPHATEESNTPATPEPGNMSETTAESTNTHLAVESGTMSEATAASTTSTTAVNSIAGTSSSWSSPRTLEGARLARYKTLAMHYGFYESPAFPKNIGEYASHLNALQIEKIVDEQERIRLRVLELRALDEWGRPLKFGKPFNGRVLANKRLDLMGQKEQDTWAAGIVHGGKTFGWPSRAEFTVEGEYRASRGLKRRMPVSKRRVDGEMAVRLMNYGMEVETAVDLMNAKDEDVAQMLKEALEEYGMDELAWRKVEAGMILKEQRERAERHRILRTAAKPSRVSRGRKSREEYYSPLTQLKVDEDALGRRGAWDELLDAMNKL